MPTFKCEYLDETGKNGCSEITASSTNEAIARLRSQSLFPTSVREIKNPVKLGTGKKTTKKTTTTSVFDAELNTTKEFISGVETQIELTDEQKQTVSVSPKNVDIGIHNTKLTENHVIWLFMLVGFLVGSIVTLIISKMVVLM